MRSKVQAFFAVTRNSIYFAYMDRGVFIEKIRGEDSTVPDNERNGGRHGFLAITRNGIIHYYEDRTRHEQQLRPLLEEVDKRFWGFRTSEIIALFIDENDANGCFTAPDRKPLDPRWREATEHTLAAIGPNHSRFIISRDRELAISYD